MAERRSADLGIDAFRDGTLRVLAAMLSLERHDAARAAREAASAERVFESADHPRRQTYMVLTHLIAGVAAIQNGNIADARSRLDRQKQFYRPEYGLDVWLHKALEGEIALATGDAQLAAVAFQRENPGRNTSTSTALASTRWPTTCRRVTDWHESPKRGATLRAPLRSIDDADVPAPTRSGSAGSSRDMCSSLRGCWRKRATRKAR